MALWAKVSHLWKGLRGMRTLDRMRRTYGASMETGNKDGRGSGKARKEAERRAKALDFWGRHGLAAAMESFEVSRPTLFRWKKAADEAREARGPYAVLRALEPVSRAPFHKRARSWDARVAARVRELRGSHPNLGKDKIAALLAACCRGWGISTPSAATVGRLVRDMGGLRWKSPVPKAVRRRGKGVLRKPKGHREAVPGGTVALDSVEVRTPGLPTFWLVTATDLATRWSWALAVPRHNSRLAALALEGARGAFPFPVRRLLTDNGSEFAGEFAKAAARLGAPHWRTFPNCPKANSHAERFNRTAREEMLAAEADKLGDLPALNRALAARMDWHNRFRPHLAFQNKLSPAQKFAQLVRDGYDAKS